MGQLLGLQETVGSAECLLENAALYHGPSLISPTQVVTFSSVISEYYFHLHSLSENDAGRLHGPHYLHAEHICAGAPR